MLQGMDVNQGPNSLDGVLQGFQVHWAIQDHQGVESGGRKTQATFLHLVRYTQSSMFLGSSLCFITALT